jgi:DNA-binding response OmpR family regulator
MRILIVEDSRRLRESLTDGLRRSGYAVDAVGDGRQGLIHARTTAYDVIVLDLMLPELGGLALLRTIRAEGSTAHVLILSARDAVEQRVEGLRAGADDYLVKPFAFDELLARIEALARRGHGHAQRTVEVGRVQLDLVAKSVRVADEPVDLTRREYALLEYLMLNAGRPLSRDEIAEHIYDDRRPIWSNAVDAAVYAVRSKLARRGVGSLIRTRRGVGYEVDADGAEDGRTP